MSTNTTTNGSTTTNGTTNGTTNTNNTSPGTNPTVKYGLILTILALLTLI